MSAPLERRGTMTWAIVGLIGFAILYLLVIQPFVTEARRQLEAEFVAESQ